MKIIKYTNRKGREFEILVDDDDYERVNEHKWWVSSHQNKRGDEICYAERTDKKESLHRFIMNVSDPKIQVDHINHDGLDNRKSNLRICTNKQNQLNKHKYVDTSSQYKGVCWHKGAQKWCCSACVNGKGKFLGYFTSEIEAAHTYDNYVKNLPDVEFRILNFPDKS